MNILSLFDGISCLRVALDRIGAKNVKYYASEIDKYATQVSKKNYPDIVRLGDVQDWQSWQLPKKIDLMVWGSPCQDLSIAKSNREGLQGEKSGLFWVAVEIWEKVKPKFWIMENVASMHKDAKEVISWTLGVEPIMINSALVSAQNRKRLFWTNIPVKQPEDKGILLKDILESGEVYKNKGINKDKSYCLDANYWKSENIKHHEKHHLRQLVVDTIKVGQVGKGGQGAKTGLYETDNIIRKLTPIECERLQTLPDNYTEGISNTQRYKCLGNSFTVDVIAHILKGAL